MLTKFPYAKNSKFFKFLVYLHFYHFCLPHCYKIGMVGFSTINFIEYEYKIKKSLTNPSIINEKPCFRIQIFAFFKIVFFVLFVFKVRATTEMSAVA